MKKVICTFLTIIIVISAMTACNFTQNMSGQSAGEAEADLKVKEMMTALTEKRTLDAQKLIHPQALENSDVVIAQMIDYLSGRKMESIEQKNINVSTSTGTFGKSVQEQVVYQVTLTDGNIIYLNVLYLSNSEGSGFASFQIVLGVV